jgi:hypothetical protein
MTQCDLTYNIRKVKMNTDEMVLKAKEDTKKIFDLMTSCFEKKIENLNEWMVVNCIIADVLKMKKDHVSEDMVKCFIDEFNEKLKIK